MTVEEVIQPLPFSEVNHVTEHLLNVANVDHEGSSSQSSEFKYNSSTETGSDSNH